MASLNRDHAAAREDDPRLDARIRSYELAAKMQLAAPEALDLTKEPEHILKLYGLEQGPQTWPKEINADEEAYLLLARNASPPAGCSSAACASCKSGAATTTASRAATGIRTRTSTATTARSRIGMARGTAALIQDLKQRGLLDDTIILWTTEFGRMPCTPGRQRPRPQPLRLHQLALRRRHQGRHHRRRKRPVGLQAARPQKPHARSTTSTPRCSTCSASTTPSSPGATTASTAASPTCTATSSNRYSRSTAGRVTRRLHVFSKRNPPFRLQNLEERGPFSLHAHVKAGVVKWQTQRT